VTALRWGTTAASLLFAAVLPSARRLNCNDRPGSGDRNVTGTHSAVEYAAEGWHSLLSRSFFELILTTGIVWPAADCLGFALHIHVIYSHRFIAAGFALCQFWLHFASALPDVCRLAARRWAVPSDLRPWLCIGAANFHFLAREEFPRTSVLSNCGG